MGCGGGGAAGPEALRRGVGARGGEFRGEAGLLTKSLRSAAEWQSDVARATKGFLSTRRRPALGRLRLAGIKDGRAHKKEG